MRRIATLAAVTTVLAAALLTGCGSDTKVVTSTSGSGNVTTREVPDVKFAKTKFVLHGGLAIGAFTRYIYKPYRAGAFKAGTPGRTKALVKAGLAAAFTANEARLARRAALSDDKLRGIGDSMSGLVAQATALGASLKGGNLDVASIAGIAGTVATVKALASKAGIDIKDRIPPGL